MKPLFWSDCTSQTLKIFWLRWITWSAVELWYTLQRHQPGSLLKRWKADGFNPSRDSIMIPRPYQQDQGCRSKYFDCIRQAPIFRLYGKYWDLLLKNSRILWFCDRFYFPKTYECLLYLIKEIILKA